MPAYGLTKHDQTSMLRKKRQRLECLKNQPALNLRELDEYGTLLEELDPTEFQRQVDLWGGQ